VEEKGKKEEIVPANFLHVSFNNLYGWSSDLPDSFDFHVDDQLLLVRRKDFDEEGKEGGNMVAIVSRPPSSSTTTTTKNKNGLTKEDNWSTDARRTIRGYFSLCSLASGTHANPVWYSFNDKGQELYGVASPAEEQTDSTTNGKGADFMNFLRFSRELFKKYYGLVHDLGFLRVAVESYFNSGGDRLLYSSTAQFINACMSLEALYNDDKSEISYKLRHRLAFVLDFDGFPPNCTFDNMKKIYGERSSIVHGSGESKDAVGYLELAQSYARRSCICFLILCYNLQGQQRRNEKKAKAELIRVIDEAMLYPDRRKALENEISEGIKEHFSKPSQMLFYVQDESESRANILGMRLREKTSGLRHGGEDWFPEPVTMIYYEGRTMEVTVNFATEEAIASNQIQYTLDGGGNWFEFGSGDARASAARYQEHKIDLCEEQKKFNIRPDDLESALQNIKFNIKFNIRRKTCDSVSLTFCRIYRPHDTTII
jgi:hypothetical protein